MDGAAGLVAATVLEGAAATVRPCWNTRSRSAARPVDPAMVEVVLDASAPALDRRHAARVLRLGECAACRALALGEPAEADVVPGSGGRRSGARPTPP